MSEIIPNLCPICGEPISERRRRHGLPPKTCSEACRKERKRRIENARYHAEKHTEPFKLTQQNYRKKLRKRLDDDPEFAAIFRAETAAANRRWREKLRTEDPARHAEIKAQGRAERAAWRENLLRDPAAWEAHKEKCRAWYRSLSKEERERIYYEPRRRRAKAGSK